MDLITLENSSSQSLIKDLVIHPLKVNKDASGVLVETLRKDWPEIYGEDRQFAMQYYSKTPSGLARDEDVWHFHPTVQEDRFIVVSGEIVTAVADPREGSETLGLLNLFYMKADAPYIVLIPKRTLHGFMVVSKEDAILLNFPTSLYNPDEEVRVPHTDVNIKTSAGNLFNWNMVRELFPALKAH